MLNKIKVAILLIISIIMIMSVSVQAKENRYVSMGYLLDGLNDIQYKDARIAFSLWVEDIAKKYDITVNINYYDTFSDAIKDYKEDKVDYLNINPLFYLQNQKAVDIFAQEYWTIFRGSQRLENYVILVQDKGDIKTVEDLKNKTIAFRSDTYLAKVFLDKELLKSQHKDSQGYIEGFLETKKYSTAILKTFFGTVDACIVPKNSLELLWEMNPAIKKKKLRVLKKSEAIFMPLLAIFHKKTEKSVIDDFKHDVNILDKSPRGRSIMKLFKMKGLGVISKEEMEPLVKYYSEYLQLKRQYVKN